MNHTCKIGVPLPDGMVLENSLPKYEYPSEDFEKLETMAKEFSAMSGLRVIVSVSGEAWIYLSDGTREKARYRKM
jgi:hypothetical protein